MQVEVGETPVKSLVQPGDGVAPLVKGINGAKKIVEILIFRFDRGEIEKALNNAVTRGVSVHALIAYTNRGGEKNLRALERMLLAAGVSVARTADDLVRYHGKMMIVDGRELYLMGFNLTQLDMERSRSFAVITDDREIVREAIRLFDADSKRLSYTPSLDTFVVSPVNARKVLSDFIKGARRQLLIYDPAVADPAIIHLLDERSKAGVEIRLIGRLSRKLAGIGVHKLSMRVHTRMLIRDGEDVFLGSQSLRIAELDGRREVGLIFRDSKITARLMETFEDDWKEPENSSATGDGTDAAHNPPPEKVAKKVAKTVIKSLPPVTPVLEVVVRELSGTQTEVDVNPEELEATVRDAVKSAIKDAVAVAVEQAAKEAE
jgi:phosphatidylserine/phosphatidylglycerophosphate/cardiolipin synthase-like enzyme